MPYERSYMTFRETLLAEIAKQEALIQRMDGNPEWDNGLMAVLRLERLDLLKKLLEFEKP